MAHTAFNATINCKLLFPESTFTFIDSLEFIKASLDTLALNLEDDDFKHSMTEFPADKLETLK